MNLLKSTLLASLVAAAANAQEEEPSIPNLNGQNFKITVVENLAYQVNVSADAGDGAPTNEQITGYMIDMIEAVADKAGFTYDLVMPSGMGSSCSPQLDPTDTANANMYSSTYRSQFNCGQEDVFEDRSDMYWSFYYITPFRQLRNAFSIPFKPPLHGALTMYGIGGEGIEDIQDLIAKQKEGKQGPVCLGQGTAYAIYLKAAFPELKYVDVDNTDEGALQGIKDGNCTITVNAYPYAMDFIANRYEAGECELNDQTFGLIGQPLGFGLSQVGVGISNSLPANVNLAISYWLNVLMTCPPGTQADDCKTPSGLSLYEQYATYGRTDPNLCRKSDWLGGVIDAVDPSGGLSDLVGGATGGGDGTGDEGSVPDATPEAGESSGDGRMLGAAAAGALGAILGRLI